MGRAALRLYRSLGLPGAGLIFFLEGIGVPIPVEIPLLIIGQRQATGVNSFVQIMLLMWLTTAAGNTIGYFVGYYGGRPLIRQLLSWFRVKPEVWDRLEGWFHQHGLKVVVGTRWINWGFAQNMWLCGMTRVPFGRFLAVMLINDLLWATAWTWVSRTAWSYLGRGTPHFLYTSAIQIGLIAVAIIFVGLAIWWAVRRFQRKSNR